MHSFFFGDSERKLYGAFQPPVGGQAAGIPVLLCYPFGQEHIRAHMAFRQIANLLSRGGRGVLRFDYFGTGDSEGALEESDFQIWVENIRTGVEELKGLSGSREVSVVGLRLGATAAAFATVGREDVRELILWDPALLGSSFLAEMRVRKSEVVDGSWWVNGFPLSQNFRDSLERIDLFGVEVPKGVSVLRLVPGGSPPADQFPEGWTDRPGGWAEVVTNDPADWNYEDEEGGLLLPHEAVGVISRWFNDPGNRE